MNEYARLIADPAFWFLMGFSCATGLLYIVAHIEARLEDVPEDEYLDLVIRNQPPGDIVTMTVEHLDDTADGWHKETPEAPGT